jgi:hypothetical protein
MYQDLSLKDLVSSSIVVREYVCTKKRLKTEIRFPFISVWFFQCLVTVSASGDFYPKMEFRFHLKRIFVSGLHYSINPNSDVSAWAAEAH